MQKKTLLSACVLVGILAVAVIVLLSNKTLALGVSGHSQLAQIIAVQTEILRAWSRNGSLKHNLAYQDTGSEVELLQKMLSQDPDAYPSKKITGYFGTATRSAVKTFQKEQGLVESGAVDAPTRKKLNDIFLAHLCPEPFAVHPEFLMKKIHKGSPLPLDYVPPSLINISAEVKSFGVTCLRADVVPSVLKLFADAKKDGVELMVISAYRKPEMQRYLYDSLLRALGRSAVSQVAEPGLSEHQLGSTIDLTDDSISFAGTDERFGSSKGGKWLQANAHKYGFIMSFPKGKQGVTGFMYEPWHWRFVGVPTATALHSQTLTFNEMPDANTLLF